MKNIANTREYKQHKARLVKVCNESTVVKTTTLPFSDKYTVDVSLLKARSKEWPTLTKSVIKCNRCPIATLYKNYYNAEFFYATWGGQDFLITEEDFLGISIVNLTQGTVQTYIPEGWLVGDGWIPRGYRHFDESTCFLTVFGNYEGRRTETRVYKLKDLNNPDFDDYVLKK